MFQSKMDDDDEDFFNPSSRNVFGSSNSKLSSIFGDTGQKEEPSLTYTAPKQPKKNAPEESKPKAAASTSSLLCAAAVHCYRYTNGQYNNVGKIGVALLGSRQTQEYKILLYVTQQSPIAQATISSNFTFELLPNNYARFYDDTRTLYSIVFGGAEPLEAFAKQVVLCVAHLTSPQQSVIVQDLQLGSGSDTLADGDAADVKYCGWVFQNGQLGQVVDSNMDKDKSFVFKLGKGKIIQGWEKGMIGMQPQSRRLIVIPPHLGYGEKGVPQRVPPNSTLVFEIHLLRMKKTESQPQPPQIAPDPVLTEPLVSEDPSAFSEHASFHDRTRSITEQMEHTSGSLRSRMAKIGTAMLPMPTVAPQISTDSLDRAPSRQSVAAEVQMEPMTNQFTHNISQSSLLSQQQTSYQKPVQVIQSAFHPIAPQYSPSPSPSVSGVQAIGMTPDLMQQQLQLLQLQQQLVAAQQLQSQQYMQPNPQQMPLLLQSQYLQLQQQQQPQTMHGSTPSINQPLSRQGEGHTQDLSGLKPAEIHKKLDDIFDQVQRLQNQTISSIPNMDARVLLENLNRIIKDNEKLKQELTEKTRKVEEQNEKISNLLQENQKHVEQSNQMLEQRNDSYKNSFVQNQSKILQLEQEKVDLTNRLSDVMSQLAANQLTLTDVKKSEQELKERLISLTEKEIELKSASESLKLEKAKRREQDVRITQLDEEISELKENNSTLSKALAEKKLKLSEEKQNVEQEMAAIKIQHEQELSALREKFREKYTAESNKLELIEEELEAKWKNKMEEALSSANKASEKRLAALEEEKEAIKEQALKFKEKIISLKEVYDEKVEELESANQQLEEAALWQQKFDKLKDYAKSMKENYDEQIEELNTTIESIKKRTIVTFSSVAESFQLNETYSGEIVQGSILAGLKGKQVTPEPFIQIPKATADQCTQDDLEPSTNRINQLDSKESQTELQSVVLETKLVIDVMENVSGVENSNKISQHVSHHSNQSEGRSVEGLSKDQQILSEIARTDFVEPDHAYVLGDKGIEVVAKEPTTVPEVAYVLGDKGIEVVAKELQIAPDVAFVLGDKGIQTGENGAIEPETAYILDDKEIEAELNNLENDPNVDLSESAVVPSSGLTSQSHGQKSGAHESSNQGLGEAQAEAIHGSSSTSGVTVNGSADEVKNKTGGETKLDVKSSQIFDSDSDDEFIKGISTQKSVSVHKEAPPPLFDDGNDDEEDLDWLK